MKTLKILVLFVIVFSGCSRGYLANPEEEIAEREVVDSWREMDVDIIRIYDGKLRLNIRVKDFDAVRGYVKSGEFNMLRSEGKQGDWPPVGALVAFAGCLGGCGYALSNFSLFPSEAEEREFNKGCAISLISCAVGGGIALKGFDDRLKYAKALRSFVKTDTICVENTILSNQKVNILVEKTGFEKEYCTDEDGNVELKIEEIIPEPTEADSVLNLIIQYKDLFDTVEVERL